MIHNLKLFLVTIFYVTTLHSNAQEFDFLFDRDNMEIENWKEDHLHLQFAIGFPFHSNPTYYNKVTTNNGKSSTQSGQFSTGMNLGLSFHPFYNRNFMFGIFGDGSLLTNPGALLSSGGYTYDYNTVVDYSAAGYSYNLGAELAVRTVTHKLKLLGRASKKVYSFTNLNTVSTANPQSYSSEKGEVDINDYYLESGLRFDYCDFTFDLTYGKFLNNIKKFEPMINYDLKLGFWYTSIAKAYISIGSSNYFDHPNYLMLNPQKDGTRVEVGAHFAMDWFWEK